MHVEIKIVNKEAATKRSTLLHAQRHACMVVHGRCTFEQSDVMLIRKGNRKEHAARKRIMSGPLIDLTKSTA